MVLASNTRRHAATVRATWSVSDVSVAGEAQDDPAISRGQLTRRTAAISDGGAAFHVFGCLFDGGSKVAL
jgi:hypothetical protein